jgi:hypothetical protein
MGYYLKRIPEYPTDILEFYGLTNSNLSSTLFIPTPPRDISAIVLLYKEYLNDTTGLKWEKQ